MVFGKILPSNQKAETLQRHVKNTRCRENKVVGKVNRKIIVHICYVRSLF